MRTTTGEGRFCASGFTSALTTMFNLTLSGCGFGGAEAQAASRQEAANMNAIGIARNVRIVSLRQWLLIRILPSSALGAVQGLEPHELFFVCLGKLVAEQIAKARVGVLDHIMKSVAIKFPVFELRGTAQERSRLELAVELLLEAPGLEIREHRIVGDAHSREHRDLVIAHVLKRVLECLDRPR